MAEANTPPSLDITLKAQLRAAQGPPSSSDDDEHLGGDDYRDDEDGDDREGADGTPGAGH